MKAIKFRMTGTCPLMLNNPQSANPMNAYAKELKALTSKRSKTDEDQNDILHLKFIASCYINSKGQYIIPANMLYKSFEAGAKENKLGKKFEQSLFVLNDALLKFDENGCTPEELWENHADKYVDIRLASVDKRKIPAARFIIPEWYVECEVHFDENQLNKGEVWNALVNAGLRHGIGTYRACYGRFSITELK